MHPSGDDLSPDHEPEHGVVRSVQEGLMVSGQVCLVGGGLDHAGPRRGGLAGDRARRRRPRQAGIGRRRHRLVAMGNVSGSSRQAGIGRRRQWCVGGIGLWPWGPSQAAAGRDLNWRSGSCRHRCQVTLALCLLAAGTQKGAGVDLDHDPGMGRRCVGLAGRRVELVGQAPTSTTTQADQQAAGPAGRCSSQPWWLIEDHGSILVLMQRNTMLMECIPILALRRGHRNQCVCVRASRLWHYHGGLETGEVKYIHMLIIDEPIKNESNQGPLGEAQVNRLR